MLEMEFSGREVNAVIKPCPFCGNQELFITDEKFYHELVGKNGNACICIECKACKTTQRLYHIPNNNYWMGVKILVVKWNTRHGEGIPFDEYAYVEQEVVD